MEKFINLMQLIPVIAAAVKNIETIVPQGGNGAEKLKAVVDSIISISDSFKEFEPQIRKIASSLVTLYNAIGIFKNSTT